MKTLETDELARYDELQNRLMQYLAVADKCGDKPAKLVRAPPKQHLNSDKLWSRGKASCSKIAKCPSVPVPVPVTLITMTPYPQPTSGCEFICPT